MIRYLPFLFLAGAAGEIASIIWMGRMIGIGPTLLLLFAGGAIGISLMKSAGTSMLTALRSPVQTGALPKGVGALAVTRVLSGGLFLLPGFLSDVAGALLLLPPVRQWLSSRFRVETFTAAPPSPADRRFDRVIEAEAVAIEGEVEGPDHGSRRR